MYYYILRELTTHSIILPSVSKGRGFGRGVEAELSEGLPEGLLEGLPEFCVPMVFHIFGG